MLGYEESLTEVSWDEAQKDILSNQSLERPLPLFKKLLLEEEEEEAREEEKDKAEKVIGIEALDLKIGEIEGIEDHPNAEKLYVMTVNFGDEKRQLVAGLKTYYTKEEMQGRKIVVVMNLKPAKLRGIESRGMLLAAEDEKGVVSLLAPLSDEDLGVRVFGRGYESEAKNKQISFSDFQKIVMKVGTVTADEKANIGKESRIVRNGISTALADTQIALYMVKGQEEAIPLVTEFGGFVTVHRRVENGAVVK